MRQSHLFVGRVFLIAALGVTACQPGDDGSRRRASAPSAPAPATVPGASTAAPSAPAHAADIPAGPLGASIRRGRAILLATHDSVGDAAPSTLRCVSCHLDEGRRPNAAPLTGVYARFPKYLDRTGEVIDVADRVNNCFTRSLAGHPIDHDGRTMRDIVAYLAWISRGVPVGTHVAGEGLPEMPRLRGDRARGERLFAGRCARCHGADGAGVPPAPALWGAGSFAIGASMAREERAASFIRHNMPLDAPGSLSDQEAYDVAAFVTTHSRPDTRGKERDWPRGGAPYDVPYATAGHEAYRAR